MRDQDWYYDDRRQVGLDFEDETEVASYDRRQQGDLEEDRQLLQDLGVARQDRVADIGCGTGLLVCAAAQLGCRVQAIDVSAAMLAASRARAEQLGLSDIDYQQAGFLTFSLQDEALDLVTSKFALHHLPDHWKALALVRVNRALRAGGHLFLRDVVFSCQPAELPGAIEGWIAWMQANTGYERAAVVTHVRDEHSTFTWVLEGLLERAGFRIVRTSYDLGVYADYLVKKVRPI